VHESVSIIDKLHRVLEGNDGLADRLERSLVEAHAKAQAELNPAVFDALDWPTDLAAYDKYLQGFLRWIPQQSDAEAWKQPAPKDRFAKEVSVRLGHFFFLIDQKVDDGDSVIAENSEVRSPLRWRHVCALHAAALGLSPLSLSDRRRGQGVVRNHRAGLYAGRRRGP